MKKTRLVKTTKKGAVFLAAVTLAAALLTGQAYPTFAEHAKIEASALIPDNITIEEPTALSNVSLPSSEYGTLSWADSSYVPTERVQSCEVVFKPDAKVDLSHISGWDSNSNTLTGYITVVVNSITEESEEPTPTPEGEETKEPTPTPEGEEPEEPTPTPEGEEPEEPTPTPEGEEPEEPTPTPEGEEPEEPTPTPEGEETKEPTPTPEGEEPEEPTPTPEGEEPEEPTPTPEGEKIEEPTPTPEGEKPTETPQPTQAPETPEDIFDREDTQEERPDTATDNLTEEEKAERARINHSSNGIYVSGIDLPWYVQFRATAGAEYEFANETEAEIFKSYEFELWDLKNDREYKIPDGQYISVTVPVKEGYTYNVEHILDNGGMEKIIPSVSGNTMVFSTHSFSPFGIAGSKPIVGGDVADKGYGEEKKPTPVPTKAPASSDTDSQTKPSAPQGNSVSGGSGQDTDNSYTSPNSGTNNGTYSGTSSQKAVETGDATMIYPFAILLVAAVAAACVVIYLKKKK